MPDEFQKATSGQPILPLVKSATWNAVMDTARWFAEQKPKGGAGADISNRRPDRVKVRNDSGRDVSQFGVLMLGPAAIDFATSDTQARRTVNARGLVPTSEAAKVGIAFAPIADGEVGDACVVGAMPVLLKVNSLSHRFAVPIAGRVDAMETASSGSASVLFAPADVGEEAMGYVLLGGGGGTSATATFEERDCCASDDGSGSDEQPGGPCCSDYYLSNDWPASLNVCVRYVNAELLAILKGASLAAIDAEIYGTHATNYNYPSSFGTTEYAYSVPSRATIPGVNSYGFGLMCGYPPVADANVPHGWYVTVAYRIGTYPTAAYHGPIDIECGNLDTLEIDTAELTGYQRFTSDGSIEAPELQGSVVLQISQNEIAECATIDGPGDCNTCETATEVYDDDPESNTFTAGDCDEWIAWSSPDTGDIDFFSLDESEFTYYGEDCTGASAEVGSLISANYSGLPTKLYFKVPAGKTLVWTVTGSGSGSGEGCTTNTCETAVAVDGTPSSGTMSAGACDTWFSWSTTDSVVYTFTATGSNFEIWSSCGMTSTSYSGTSFPAISGTPYIFFVPAGSSVSWSKM